MDISIIVPCYNSSRYISRCIHSICEQSTSADFEIIFVDDYSKDNTIEEIYTNLEKNKKVNYQIIKHETNKGVAEARITGIKNAKGDYILFCDSDDYIDSHMCEILYNRAVKDDCDLVICDYIDVYDDYSSICHPCYLPNFLQSLLLCKCTGSLWNKLIKRTILMRMDFLFPTASYCEDYVYSIQLAIYANNIAYVAKPLYNYVHRSDSIVNSKSSEAISKRVRENLENHALVENILEYNGLSSIYFSEKIALRLIVKNSIRLYIPQKGYYKLWLRTFPELTIDIFRSKHISWKARIAYFLTMFGLYHCLVKCKK